MARTLRALLHFSTLAALIALAACGPPDGAQFAAVDRRIAVDDIDPALISALADPILVDPTLTQQSNRNAVRPAESPVQGQYPAPVEAAQDEMAAGSNGACGAPFDYNPDHVRRLPAAFPVYPGGALTEAAVNDKGDCEMRVVTFTTRDGPARVIGWYQDRAVRAGFSATRRQRGADLMLDGIRPADGNAFYLIVAPAGSGSDVALIANNGR